MDVSEIVDGKSLEAWLNSLPRGTEAEKTEAWRWAVQIAHRVAMRVLPNFWHWSLTNEAIGRKEAPITALWPCMVSGVTGKIPSTRLTSAARAASHFTGFAPIRAADSVVGSAEAFTYAAQAACSLTLAGAASEAAAAADAAATWEDTRIDCAALGDGQDLNALPLWPAENPLADIWRDTRKDALAQGPDWKFWVDWYDKSLRGEPQDWGLLEKIALDPEIDWDKDADHVNALIADIRLKRVAETRPLGEDAIDKGADGLWHCTGRADIDRDILQDARDSVIDVIDRVRDRLQLNNSLSALAPEIDLLDRALTRYPDRPTRLHDTFLHVQNHIARNLASGELHDDDIVDDLNQVMGTAALDMRNACAKTRQVVEARIEARFANADPSARAVLVSVTMAAAQISDPDLAVEFVEDAQVIEGTLQPVEDEKSLLYRLTTRLAKMVTEDGGNITRALILIGGLGSGYMTLKQLTYFLPSHIL